MATYGDYYQRAIDANAPGIKLVLGPTGLGKSDGIKDVVRANPDRKFVYMANRKQLLDEMALRLVPGEFVVLRRDLEVVLEILRSQRPALDDLLADRRFRESLSAASQRSHLKNVDLAAIRRACDELAEMESMVRPLPPLMSKHADKLARDVLLAFRWVLQVARDREERTQRYQWLASHPIIEALFPALPFRRKPSVRIMLMTLQKGYYGFFDGAQTRNLTNLTDDESLVVFLDEFDFLEHELVALICRAPQVDDPFDFTAHFHRAMANHKLPNPDFPREANIRRQIEDIVGLVEEVRARDLRFPDINQFTLEKRSSKYDRRPMMPAIFRTRHTVSTSKLYVAQTQRSFQLEPRRDNPKWVPADWFFGKIGSATTRILALFKGLERDDEVLYWEVLRQCFRNTDFFDQVSMVAQFPHRPQPQTGPRGTLLDGGYSLFDIDDLQQRTDSEEVAVRFYQMLQTPENLLRKLADRRLVFGLSATADLPRCVHHFDLTWLGGQGLLQPITDEDRADIQRMSADKAARRGGRTSIAEVDQLDGDAPDQALLQRFLDAVARDDEFDEDTAAGHRSLRMHRFFAAIHWLLAHGGVRPRLLLFLNTFRQVRLLLTTFAAHASDAGVFSVEAETATKWFEVLRLQIWGRTISIVFFNAALATEIRQSKEAEAAFARVFWRDDPVIVVTQYLSAGNGVNLQYTDDEHGPKRDFTHIALLEAPYFFFTKPDAEMPFDEIVAGRKENIWYQAKLFAAHLISRRQFKQALATLTHPNEWNVRYQQGPTATDCLLNQVAIFIQALGRVEREWAATPDQVALLSPDVFRVFQAFAGPDFEPIREERAPFTSSNLQAVLEAVAARSTAYEREARRKRDERLRVANGQCREAVWRLVSRLETLRRAGIDPEARHDWEALRRAVLQHDFHAEVVGRHHCATTTPYLSRGRLNLTPELDILPIHVQPPQSRVLHLNALYGVIADNVVVRDHFLDQGLDLRFDHPGMEFFTPYCLQAILAGAIGEEAIAALLRHEGVPVEPLPDELFEIADMKIAGLPWFIDSKNYSELTLDRFSLPVDDPLWHPTLNESTFTAHAREKLARIAQHVGPESKLIYINLISSQPRPLGYYTGEFTEVMSFAEAQVVIVQGALKREEPNCYHDAFATFLADVRREMSPPQGIDSQNKSRATGNTNMHAGPLAEADAADIGEDDGQ